MWIVWTCVGLYLSLIVILQIPYIQKLIASDISKILSQELSNNISIGKVNLGLLNRIIIDDVYISDLNNKTLLQTTRLSATWEYLPLLRGKIRISSIQLFGMKAMLYKNNEKEETNFQFLIDKLSSKNTNNQENSIDLKINSLIVRRSTFTWDKNYIAHKKNSFDINHLHAEKISGHFILRSLQKDSLNIGIKKLSLEETSGLSIKNITLNFIANTQGARLTDVKLSLPNSELYIDKLLTAYQYKNNNIVKKSIKYKGTIQSKNIDTEDFRAFLQKKHFIKSTFKLNAKFSGTYNILSLNDFEIKSKDDSFKVKTTGSIENVEDIINWQVSSLELNTNKKYTKYITSSILKDSTASIYIHRLGNIQLKAKAKAISNNINGTAKIKTDIGELNILLKKQGIKILIDLNVKDIAINKILNNKDFGNVSANITLTSDYNNKKLDNVKTASNISTFEYKGYKYSNIKVNGSFISNIINSNLSINDPNVSLDLNSQIKIKDKQYLKLKTKIRNLSPVNLGITSKWKGKYFSANIVADIEGSDIDNANGSISIKKFCLHSDKDNFRINDFEVGVSSSSKIKSLYINSDFCNLFIEGKYRYNSLVQSIINAIKDKLPNLPLASFSKKNRINNDFSIQANIYNTAILQHLLNINLDIKDTLELKGRIYDKESFTNITVKAPSLVYNGTIYEQGYINLKSFEDSVMLNTHIRKLAKNGSKLYLNVQAKAINSILYSTLTVNNIGSKSIKGKLITETTFEKDGNKNIVSVEVKPSIILLSDTIWKVSPSKIKYKHSNIEVQNFSIFNDMQYLKIDGFVTKNTTDSLSVDFKGVDVEYIMNLINFHSVDFSGYATGKASIKGLLSSFETTANVVVDNFRLQQGRLGTLYAGVNYNVKKGQIDIDAIAKDDDNRYTIVNGFVSPKHNNIDLTIKAENTRAEFLESFCSSFMKNVRVNANGELRLHGSLNKINLTGSLIANGTLDISTLNTTYALRNNTINLFVDRIELNADTIVDRLGNIGVVNGKLHHQNLKNLSYDIDIKTKNLLVYDSKAQENFYGTVYGTGNCYITGKSGEVNIDVNITPESNSVFVYNVSNPNNVEQNNFIHWKSKNEIIEVRSRQENKITSDQFTLLELPSDIRINMLINCTPSATLKLIMNEQSGDNITLNGNGTVRANYYNKGAFEMFGNYIIERGKYSFTIQNVIRKDFYFKDGGNITFGGNPYDAQINLNAIYSIPSVSLSDLNIGRSFANNNIKVDCLMNITGTPTMPKVDFSLDMPNVNSNIKEMIYSLINGEEEMRQQVVYLLAVGRFYTQGQNNAINIDNSSNTSQTSLAMQSLISGTLSQQLNNILGSVIKSRNWNFGTNISTGEDGWNNAEYEGIFRGQLLNNRLLFNGQIGYRDNDYTQNSNFIGDFDLRYLLIPNGNIALRMYNQTNSRYFTRNSLTTQGIGILIKKDFSNIKELFGKRKSINK